MRMKSPQNVLSFPCENERILLRSPIAAPLLKNKKWKWGFKCQTQFACVEISKRKDNISMQLKSFCILIQGLMPTGTYSCPIKKSWAWCFSSAFSWKRPSRNLNINWLYWSRSISVYMAAVYFEHVRIAHINICVARLKNVLYFDKFWFFKGKVLMTSIYKHRN